ncbi:hypothetical protein [Advenella mimigardefordensis]|nr:hypothetical protein [Advenella mimigardefordensis]
MAVPSFGIARPSVLVEDQRIYRLGTVAAATRLLVGLSEVALCKLDN